MENQTDTTFLYKAWIWAFGNVIVCGVYFLGCQAVDAYQRAFPSTREQLAKSVSLLLDADTKTQQKK